MSNLQIDEFLIETVERLLEIAKEQNAKLAELNACFAGERISEIENKYNHEMNGVK